MKRVVHLAALAAGLTAGCEAVFGGDDYREEMAVIALYGQPALIRLPATVRRSERFDVTVLTINDCETREASHTATSVYGLQIEITPYRRRVPQINCPDRYYTDEHTVSVRFFHRGTGRVVVMGRHERGDTIRVEHTVEVR